MFDIFENYISRCRGDWKCRRRKMTDKIAGLEYAGPGMRWTKSIGWKNTWTHANNYGLAFSSRDIWSVIFRSYIFQYFLIRTTFICSVIFWSRKCSTPAMQWYFSTLTFTYVSCCGIIIFYLHQRDSRVRCVGLGLGCWCLVNIRGVWQLNPLCVCAPIGLHTHEARHLTAVIWPRDVWPPDNWPCDFWPLTNWP